MSPRSGSMGRLGRRLKPTRACCALRPPPAQCGGDGLADIVGRRLGKGNPLPWNPEKSWAGSAAMFVGECRAPLRLSFCSCSGARRQQPAAAPRRDHALRALLATAPRQAFFCSPCAGGLAMSLGLIALFTSLGYFECDWPAMALTGAGVSSPWARLEGRCSVQRGGSFPGRSPGALRPKQAVNDFPPRLPRPPPVQWGPSRWRPPPSSRCPSTARWTTTCRCPAWPPSWAYCFSRCGCVNCVPAPPGRPRSCVAREKARPSLAWREL